MSAPILSALSEPMAMEPQRFRALVEDARAGRLEAAAPAVKAEFAPKPKPRTDGIAVVPIVGPLFRASSPVEALLAEMFGATTYDAISAQVTAAADAGVPIVLDINSPGGSVDGVQETADAIKAAAERVAVVAHVRGMGASAAYWLASSAHKIVASRTSRVGSIGVVAGLLDDAGAQAAEGVKRIQIVSSVSPDKRSEPVDGSVIARIQAHVDDMASLFVEHVAAGRGKSFDTVAQTFGRGDVMIASKALAAGMIDDVGTIQTAARVALDEQARRMTEKRHMDETNAAAAVQSAELEALAALGRETIKALSATNADDAAGALVAAAEAMREIAPLRAEVQTLRAATNRQELRAVLVAGIQSGRLSLGDIAATVPSMLTDEARSDAMVAALEARTETTQGATLDAVCGVDVTAAEVKRIRGWSERKPATLAKPIEAPARDANAEAVAATKMDADAQRVSNVGEQTRARYRKFTNASGTAASAK